MFAADLVRCSCNKKIKITLFGGDKKPYRLTIGTRESADKICVSSTMRAESEPLGGRRGEPRRDNEIMIMLDVRAYNI